MTWRIHAARARGTSHTARGLPCQDAFAHGSVDDWLLAVVCDGAGSAPASHLGATATAQETIDRLRACAHDLSAMDLVGFTTLITELLGEVRAARVHHAELAHTAVGDYACTVVGVVACADGGWFFHIGDGVGVACGAATDVISPAANDEYANETFFLTGHDWHSQLRVTPIPAGIDRVILMSDGSMPFALAKGGQALYAPFINPVLRFLADADEATGSAALASMLDDPRTHTITGDDKTLLIALHR